MLHAINEWCAQRDILQLTERPSGLRASLQSMRLHGMCPGDRDAAEGWQPSQIIQGSAPGFFLLDCAIQDISCLDPGRYGCAG